MADVFLGGHLRLESSCIWVNMSLHACLDITYTLITDTRNLPKVLLLLLLLLLLF